MNLLLLAPEDLHGDRAEIRDERVGHVRRILRAEPGDELRVGRLDGPLGRGRISVLERDRLVLDVAWGEPPPAPRSQTLVLALPRPKFLGRILRSATEIGIKEIELIGTARVEKSYWESSSLGPAAVRRQLRIGLEQARDTVLPAVRLEPSFDRFAAERLAALSGRGRVVVAHAEGSDPFPPPPEISAIVVGPEGGLVDAEVDLLARAGASLVGLGPRALRVETAVCAALGRLL